MALELSDYAYIMSKGKIVHESKPGDILLDESIMLRYLGVGE
jgi:ABC-type branched-subunit amino acid transport system ATPase component